MLGGGTLDASKYSMGVGTDYKVPLTHSTNEQNIKKNITNGIVQAKSLFKIKSGALLKTDGTRTII
ncbi:TPA: hypothetical protein ACPJQW_001054 [Haemophilus influenzae]